MKDRRLFIFLFLITLLISCSLDQKKEYLITYNVLVDANNDNYDFFTMNMDGSEKKNITLHPDVAWCYLAFGNTLFFLSDRDTTRRQYFLYEMNSAGEQLKKITDFRMQDSWLGIRNGGSELIISPHPKVDTLLYLVKRNGQIIDKVFTGTPYAANPVFSPDGNRIAFVGKNKKSKKEEGYREEIYVVNVDGTDLIQLSHYPEKDTTAEWWAYKAGPPRWHPTEDFISFQSKQNGKYSLYAVTPDGAKQWKMTDNEQEEGWHDWSPDGQWLAVELFDKKQTQFHIGLMHWQSKELKILTDTTYQYQQAPVFVEKTE